MHRTVIAGALAGLVSASLPSASHAAQPPYQHVLLISIDGMHAVDYQICVSNGSCPALARLDQHRVHYTRTSTSKPSDSFPGLMAIVSGGSAGRFAQICS